MSNKDRVKTKTVTLKLTPEEAQAVVTALHWAESWESDGETVDHDFEAVRFKVLHQARGKLPVTK
jgi:predicted DNA-binding transcriptional regulator YafY